MITMKKVRFVAAVALMASSLTWGLLGLVLATLSIFVGIKSWPEWIQALFSSLGMEYVILLLFWLNIVLWLPKLPATIRQMPEVWKLFTSP